MLFSTSCRGFWPLDYTCPAFGQGLLMPFGKRKKYLVIGNVYLVIKGRPMVPKGKLLGKSTRMSMVGKRSRVDKVYLKVHG